MFIQRDECLPLIFIFLFVQLNVSLKSVSQRDVDASLPWEVYHSLVFRATGDLLLPEWVFGTY